MENITQPTQLIVDGGEDVARDIYSAPFDASIYSSPEATENTSPVAALENVSQESHKIRKTLAMGLAASIALLGAGVATASNAEATSTDPATHALKTEAHRGLTSRRIQENTIKSGLNAIAHHFKWIEGDVRFTADGVPVLMHDPKTGRTMDGRSLSIAGHTLAQLQKGHKYKGERGRDRIDTLQEYVATLAPYANQIGIENEIKAANTTPAELAQMKSIYDAAGFSAANHNLRIESFYEGQLAQYEAIDPDVPKDLISNHPLPASRLNEHVDALIMPWKAFSRAQRGSRGAYGASVISSQGDFIVWNVETWKEKRDVESAGGSVITDRPLT